VSETVESTERPPSPPPKQRTGAAGAAAAEFERIYRAQVDAVTAFFARRSAEPQAVADLTADTFVQAITSFGTFDPRRGTPRAWVFGIARRVYAAHCDAATHHRDRVQRMAGRRELDPDQFEELVDRIDAQRAGRDLLVQLADLPESDRLLVELVDIDGLKVKEAAVALGMTPGAARMRLMRARTRLRGTETTKGEKK